MRRKSTKLVQEGTPVAPPIVTATTFAFPKVQNAVDVGFNGAEGHFYTRWSNPNRDYTANMINSMEHGQGTVLFSSGMQAVTSIFLSLLKSGDHIIVPNTFYAGVSEFCRDFLPNYGISVTTINVRQSSMSSILNEYESNIIANKTKLIYNETPCNPLNTTIDLTKFSQLAKKYNVYSVIDSTFASPFNQLPIRDHNIDIVAHSCTKYLNGHSDVTAGSVTCADEKVFNKIQEYTRLNGGILSPFDCYLLQRGAQTLGLRMNFINENALKVANWLQNEVSRDIISKVYYAGNKVCYHGDSDSSNSSVCEHHIAHCNNMRKMDKDNLEDKEWTHGFEAGFGGTFSFELNINNPCFDSLSKVMNAVDQLKYIRRAVSLGGMETLCEIPIAMTHFDNENPEYSHGLIRISIGTEPAEMIIDDIDQNLVKPARNVKPPM